MFLSAITRLGPTGHQHVSSALRGPSTAIPPHPTAGNSSPFCHNPKIRTKFNPLPSPQPRGLRSPSPYLSPLRQARCLSREGSPQPAELPASPRTAGPPRSQRSPPPPQTPPRTPLPQTPPRTPHPHPTARLRVCALSRHFSSGLHPPHSRTGSRLPHRPDPNADLPTL